MWTLIDSNAQGNF
ncbi:hypothetical protein TRUGW13939_11542 [Talaromyces rugulosus]|uniref:Uncharacterized protein n=1 Tax=Talaromyces rugulosus TaxID=121627 RepID=A0A7H8REC4_TALRU|nr:hypothetical protein TRUGW13939_11542 [Talaromyces rugulosus]